MIGLNDKVNHFAISDGGICIRSNCTVGTGSRCDHESIQCEGSTNFNIFSNIVNCVGVNCIGVFALFNRTAAVVSNGNDVVSIGRISDNGNRSAFVVVHFERFVHNKFTTFCNCTN